MSGSTSNSSSSIVISFSIAILLLLVLLLLLSYNNRFKNDRVERFDTSSSLGGMLGNTIGSSVDPLYTGFNNILNDLNKNKKNTETFSTLTTNDPYMPNGIKSINKQQELSQVMPSDNTDNYMNINGTLENFADTPMNTNDPTTCIKKDKLTAKDLLPKDISNLKWSQVNPSSIGDITDQNFNTIGQTLKNANLQLRSEIPNPQVAVSPWMISTIEPDVRTTTLEIGSAPSY